jgi:hypothetical protein
MSPATVEPLQWDSAFFGFAVAEIAAERPDERDLEDALEACRKRGVRCAYLLLDASDARGGDAAQALGFVLRDVRVELNRAIDTADATADVESVVAVDPARLPALESLARERLTMSRFFADPNFPRERCQELYVAFLRRGVEGAPDRWALATADHSGFAVCHVDPRKQLGTFELAAVRRPGDGAMLVRAGLARFARAGVTSARIVTQAQNIASQRSFQRAGFRTSHSSLWFHRWFD